MKDFFEKHTVIYKDGVPFGNHYNAIVSDDKDCQPNVLESNNFSVLCNHNGTDVERFKAELILL